MLAEKFLRLLVCPETRIGLAQADAALLDRLNGAIAKAQLKNRGGHVVEKPLEGALVRQDAAVAYPIVDEIPLLLVDEGIALDQISG